MKSWRLGQGSWPGAGEAGRHPRVELLADADRPWAWMLLVDGVPQSHVDLDSMGRARIGFFFTATRWPGELANASRTSVPGCTKLAPRVTCYVFLDG
jgi:hypothetical protein